MFNGAGWGLAAPQALGMGAGGNAPLPPLSSFLTGNPLQDAQIADLYKLGITPQSPLFPNPDNNRVLEGLKGGGRAIARGARSVGDGIADVGKGAGNWVRSLGMSENEWAAEKAKERSESAALGAGNTEQALADLQAAQAAFNTSSGLAGSSGGFPTSMSTQGNALLDQLFGNLEKSVDGAKPLKPELEDTGNVWGALGQGFAQGGSTGEALLLAGLAGLGAKADIEQRNKEATRAYEEKKSSFEITKAQQALEGHQAKQKMLDADAPQIQSIGGGKFAVIKTTRNPDGTMSRSLEPFDATQAFNSAGAMLDIKQALDPQNKLKKAEVFGQDVARWSGTPLADEIFIMAQADRMIPGGLEGLLADESFGKKYGIQEGLQALQQSIQQSQIESGAGTETSASQAQAQANNAKLTMMADLLASNPAIRTDMLKRINTQTGAMEASPEGDAAFRKNVSAMFGVEGGYNPSDGRSNAPVNMGINQAANPDLDVKTLTKKQAEARYKSKYWDDLGLGAIADPALQASAFDAAVNQGENWTKQALAESGGSLEVFNDMREARYRNLVEKDPTQEQYLEPWLDRIGQSTLYGAGLAGAGIGTYAMYKQLYKGAKAPLGAEPLLALPAPAPQRTPTPNLNKATPPSVVLAPEQMPLPPSRQLPYNPLTAGTIPMPGPVASKGALAAEALGKDPKLDIQALLKLLKAVR